MGEFPEGIRVHVERSPHPIWQSNVAQGATKDDFGGWRPIVPEVCAALVNQNWPGRVPDVQGIVKTGQDMILRTDGSSYGGPTLHHSRRGRAHLVEVNRAARFGLQGSAVSSTAPLSGSLRFARLAQLSNRQRERCFSIVVYDGDVLLGSRRTRDDIHTPDVVLARLFCNEVREAGHVLASVEFEVILALLRDHPRAVCTASANKNSGPVASPHPLVLLKRLVKRV